MDAITWQAWATFAVVAAMFGALVRGLARPDLVVVGAVGVLVALGILTPQEAFAGFSSGAVIAVASLFVVAAAVQNAGALAAADRLMFPRQGRPGLAVAQVGLVVGALSAFLNNTPLVAMAIPRVRAWCEQHGVAPSRLMIPVSYAAILGGTLTLVGTSTNLVVSGLMEDAGAGPLGLFSQTPVAVPAALAAFGVLIVGSRLLPDRGAAEPPQDRLARCLFEVRVTARGPLDGQTVEAAGLRALGDAFLAHVRTGPALAPASPETVLRGGDVLLFRGSARAMEALVERDGLERPLAPEATSAGEPARTLPLFEAVVSETSALAGRSLREVAFRERYGGVVLAVERNGQDLDAPMGRTPLRAGDLLVVEAGSEFARRWGADRQEFYLVSARRGARPERRPGQAPLAVAVLVGVVALAAIGVAPIETTAFVGALVLVATRCLTGAEARRAVELPTLVVIAASLGIGHAIESTGLAAALAGTVASGSGMGPLAVVAAVYVATSLLTELITNNAAAALMVGVALEAAAAIGVAPEVLGVTVALAASASFLTPIGYQANLMVMGPGGYRFGDFIRAGAPVALVHAAVSVGTIWALWL